MKLVKIKELLDAEVLCCEEFFDMDIKAVCGSDLLSDVLAYTDAHALLLTGLINPQVIRTAELVELSAICFVRGKKPDNLVVMMAEKKNIPLLRTRYHMYEACGKLFIAGLACGEKVAKDQ